MLEIHSISVGDIVMIVLACLSVCSVIGHVMQMSCDETNAKIEKWHKDHPNIF